MKGLVQFHGRSCQGENGRSAFINGVFAGTVMWYQDGLLSVKNVGLLVEVI